MSRGYYVDKMGVCLPVNPYVPEQKTPEEQALDLLGLLIVLTCLVLSCLFVAWLKGLL